MNTKLSRIKETLKSVLAQFQSERITTDKGIVDVQKAGDEVAVGDTIMGVDEEGNTVALESGEYILTDGTILKVEDGKIAEIVVPELDAPEEKPAEEEVPAEEEAPAEEEKPEEEPEAPAEEEAPVEEPAEEKEEPAEEEPKEEEAPAEEEKPAEEEPEVENPTNEGEESETEAVVKLREEVNELYKVVDELTKRLDALEKKPAAESATEEFAKVNKIGKTGNEKLDRLAKFVNA